MTPKKKKQRLKKVRLMERIKHEIISTNGIKMHVASMGRAKGPAILFLHGFPELWYSWRHQLVFFSDFGFRAIAPDLRGYSPASPATFHSYTFFHIVGDLIGLLDHFHVDRVFLVGHDWGAAIAWAFAVFRPDRIKALVALSAPFCPRHEEFDQLTVFRLALGHDYYTCRFQESNEMEEVFDSMDKENLFKIIFSIHSPEPLMIPKGKSIKEFPVPDTLPSWLSEDDISYYASKYVDIGFHGGINYFRATKLNWELTAPWSGVKVEVPTKFIVGEQDFMYHILGLKSYIHDGAFQRDVPKLKEVVVIEGAGHYVQQERPEEINKHILKFIKKF